MSNINSLNSKSDNKKNCRILTALKLLNSDIADIIYDTMILMNCLEHQIITCVFLKHTRQKTHPRMIFALDIFTTYPFPHSKKDQKDFLPNTLPSPKALVLFQIQNLGPTSNSAPIFKPTSSCHIFASAFTPSMSSNQGTNKKSHV